MSFVQNISKQTSRPVGSTTLGKLGGALGAYLLIVLAFGYIADEVLEGDTQGVDTHVLQAIHTIYSPQLTHFVMVMTQLGSVLVVGLLTAALAIYLAYAKRWRAVAFTLCAMGGTVLTFTLLKMLFERHRPVLYNLVAESTYSFPSGHASLSCALALTVILLAWHTKWRWLTVGVGTLYVLLIGFSRLYLTVHYPTDVLAGWLVGASWVLIVATIIGAVNWPSFKRLRGQR